MACHTPRDGSSKRKRLTLELKHDVLKELENTESTQEEIAEKFGIVQSTVSEIWKERENINTSFASSESPELANKKRCIIQ